MPENYHVGPSVSKRSGRFNADNFRLPIQFEPQAAITGFLIALAAGTFHDAFQKSYIEQQIVRLPLDDFIVDRFVDDPAVLTAKSAQLFAVLQEMANGLCFWHGC